MKLSIQPNFKAFPSLIKKHFQFVLWGFLIFVLVMEFFVIKDSIDLILIARAPAPGAQAQLVRVNFEQYKLIEKRLEDDSQFNPDPVKYTSPFGAPPQ